mmetsp:Transcript_33831/g.60644  ORF Transcript_33831/g.60644 Transcript_33831/m.60644 type:complete len:117 (-) Transcript_33831:2388-2738(-)
MQKSVKKQTVAKSGKCKKNPKKCKKLKVHFPRGPTSYGPNRLGQKQDTISNIIEDTTYIINNGPNLTAPELERRESNAPAPERKVGLEINPAEWVFCGFAGPPVNEIPAADAAFFW